MQQFFTKKNVMWGGAGAVALITSVVVWMWCAPTDSARPPAPPQTPTARSTQTSTASALPDLLTEFRSEPFRFSLIIPKTMSIQEFPESGDARTYVFAESEGKSFQVYVTPYNKDHIDAERFALDQPSGVVRERQEIEVAGTRAVAFFGKNTAMGETREVWFIRDGLLYEVTVAKAEDAWFSELMKTWSFF